MDKTELVYDEERPDDGELGIIRNHEQRVIKIFVSGAIDDDFLVKFWRQMEAAKASNYHVQVCLNTPGGKDYVYIACIDLIEALKRSKPDTECIAVGLVASAGVPIFLAFDRRLILPHTVLMIHDGETTDTANSLAEAKANYKEILELHQIYTKFIAERTDNKLKQVVRWCDQETRFLGAACVVHRFATGITVNP